MKYYIVAGEASGEVHGAQLARRFRSDDPTCELRGIGGQKMEEAGVSLLFRFSDIAVMGFWDVLCKVLSLRGFLNRCKEDISLHRPDAVVLIDSAGFNLRIAKYTRELDHRIKIFYFVPPKIWAWGGWRIKQLRHAVDQIIVLFPFEQEYFESKGLSTHYFGYPASSDDSSSGKRSLNQIALLPGSRLQEINSTIPVMAEVAHLFPDYQFIICGMDVIREGQYGCRKFSENVELRWNCTAEVLEGSTVAVVTSGTATLEACYAEVPQVVVYRTSSLNYWIARLLIRVRYISLVNLVAGKKVVNELIQSNFNAESLSTELNKLILDQNYRNSILNSYKEIKEKLTGRNVYDKISDLITSSLSGS